MIGLLQRVTEARVEVGGTIIAEIGAGLLVFVGVERGDTVVQADRMLERLLGYRVLPDAEGRMNRSLEETGGGLLLVPQFTLAAETKKGMRPSFTPAAEPSEGQRLFAYLSQRAQAVHPTVAYGRFGSHMHRSGRLGLSASANASARHARVRQAPGARCGAPRRLGA